jgi:3'-phosphoadenosine 5'-phosphosulfate sulfotransferase (PAPS reductase)/FAD synthetase
LSKAGEIEEKARKVLNNVKEFTVLWSGGKDSTALLLWVLDNVKHSSWNVLYAEITGNTSPLCNEYVITVAEKLGLYDRLLFVKTRDFYELAERWGPPLLGAYRWCLYRLKKPAFRQGRYILVSGVRRADSKVRRRGSWINRLLITDRQVVINPIFEWSREMVLDYLKDRGVPLNPCYSRYGHSGNCMFCPYADKKHIVLTMQDEYWRSKILLMLERHREGLMKGSIGRRIYEDWTAKWRVGNITPWISATNMRRAEER